MQEHSMTHIKMGNDFDCPVGNCLSRFTAHAGNLDLFVDEFNSTE